MSHHLVQPQGEFSTQDSPDKRTETVGNFDPNSGEFSSKLQRLAVVLVWLCISALNSNSQVQVKGH
jgi:hypothetical protein